MGARFDCFTMHAWDWMQTWRVALSAPESKDTEHRQGQRFSPPWSEDVTAAAWLRLPPGTLFVCRLGLDLGIPTDLVLGSRRHL